MSGTRCDGTDGCIGRDGGRFNNGRTDGTVSNGFWTLSLGDLASNIYNRRGHYDTASRERSQRRMVAKRNTNERS